MPTTENRASLILIGAGGHAASCIDVIESQGTYEIFGLIGNPEEVGRRHFGYPVLGADRDLADLVGQVPCALVTVGSIYDLDNRAKMVEGVKNLGFDLPTIIAKTAYVSRHASIGMGTIVMHGAIINSGAIVGKHCIINTQALVEHGATVGDFCHISTGARLNGGVSLGSKSFLGSGSIIKNDVSIGRNCFIGLGQKVTHDIVDRARIINL
jgi:sugar O-acyltransferase (sialic acid O-acetyltransferase NeuD family)